MNVHRFHGSRAARVAGDSGALERAAMAEAEVYATRISRLGLNAEAGVCLVRRAFELPGCDG